MIVNIFAVGDIMLGEQSLSHKFGVDQIIKKKGASYLFNNVETILLGGDIIFGNLEAPISKYSKKKDIYKNYFLAHPNVIKSLKNSHFNVLSVANNHIMEHGKEAFLSTINILKENNILPIGIKDEINIVNIKGYKILFLSYSFIEDNINKCLYNKIISEEKIIVDIEQNKDIVDLVIVTLHWGKEYVPFPSLEQIRMGRRIIDSGANMILGGHPHVIQSYEIYKGKPIIYSLGNFIFDHTYIKNTEKSVLIKIMVDMNTKNTDVKIIPIICDLKEYYPKLAINDDKILIMNEINNTRALIENNTACEHLSYIENYQQLVNKHQKSAKNDMKIHFLKNITKYPISISLNIFKKHAIKWINNKLN